MSDPSPAGDSGPARPRRPVARAVGEALRLLVRLYQLTLSPILGASCRFAPSCSEYAREALRIHGPVRGSWLGAKRLGRCHPLTAGGFDPVPARPGPSPRPPQA